VPPHEFHTYINQQDGVLVVVWIKHALEKQALLADPTGGDDLPALDSALRGWATDVRVRPSDLEDALRSRTTALQLVTNLRRSVAASVIEEIVRVAERSPNGTAYSVLEQHAQQFQNDTESRCRDPSTGSDAGRRLSRSGVDVGVASAS